MNFYYVNANYIEYLRRYDDKVALHKNVGNSRPYVGVVLSIHDSSYYVPLTSPKEKHKTMKNGKDFRRIKQGKLGAINFNNMIPVPDNMIERVIISDISDMKYRSLLNDQYKALLSDWNNIQNTANKLYNLYMTADEHLSAYELTVKSRCCNFELLEQKCKEFHLQNENSNIE